MKASVITPCFNCATTLGQQLDALLAQSWAGEWEIIVSDNGSTDGTLDLIESYRRQHPHIRLLDASGRRGQAYARNHAAAMAQGEFLLFCDGDDVVGEGWLVALASALEKADFVAGRLVVSRINPEWVVKTRPGALDLEKEAVHKTHGYLPWASSSNMGIKRSVYKEAGGFDEAMPALEDVDLCWKVQRLGIPLTPVPEAWIHYRLRSNCSGIFRQSRLYAENFVLLYRNYQDFGLSPPVPSLRALLRNWLRLLKQAPRAFLSAPGRGEWMWHFGWRLGSLTGSLKHRLFVP